MVAGVGGTVIDSVTVCSHGGSSREGREDH